MTRIRCLSPLRTAALAALALLAPAWALAQEAAVTKRATELRDSGAAGGRSLASLPAQTPVTRLPERQGPYVQVRTSAGATGWVHLFDLAPATGSAVADGSGGSGALRGVTNLIGRGGNTSSTSASGIRGLTAQDIAGANPNPAAVGQMEAMRQSEKEARDFAARAPLRTANVDPLPAPARAPTGSAGGDPSNPQPP